MNRVIKNNDGSAFLIMRKVRLSYPYIFEPSAFEGQEPKYSANFIIPKTGDMYDNIAAAKEAVQHVIAVGLKGTNPGKDKLCLKDGATKLGDDGEPKDGYGEETVFVTASNKRRPVVCGPAPDFSPLVADDNVIYAGCYVNAKVRLWPQDNRYGKRVNGSLVSIQYHSEGEPFGEGASDPSKDFAFDDEPSGSFDDDPLI